MFGPYDRFRSAKKAQLASIGILWRITSRAGKMNPQKTLCDYRDFICNLPLTQKMHKCKQRKLRPRKRNLKLLRKTREKPPISQDRPGFHYLRNVFSKP